MKTYGNSDYNIAPNETKEIEVRYIHNQKPAADLIASGNTIVVNFWAFKATDHSIVVDTSKFDKRAQEKFKRLLKKYPELKQ